MTGDGTLKTVKKAALTLLNRREYSIGELRAKLTRRFPDAADAVEQTLDACVGYGYLNDTRLAERLVEGYATQRHFGPTRIRHEMARRKLPEAAWKDALERVCDQQTVYEAAVAATRKHVGREMADWDVKRERRLSGFLGRRGFSGATIHAMVRRIRQGNLWVDDDPHH